MTGSIDILKIINESPSSNTNLKKP